MTSNQQESGSGSGNATSGEAVARVLLVDDESELLAEMTETLQQAGFEALATTRPRDAMTLVTRRRPIDVIITDIRMPEIEGLDLIEILKARLQEQDGTQFVVVTGNPSVSTAVGSLRAGAADFLSKPIGCVELIRAVDAAAARARRIRRAHVAPDGEGRPADAPRHAEASDRAEPRPDEGGNGLDAGTLRAILKARQRRADLFDPDLVAEPAWDMLIDLALAKVSGQRLSVTDLCLSGRVPMTTALRRIEALVAHRLVARTPDPTDARRRFVDLTEDGMQRLLRYLGEVGPQGGA